MRRLLGLALLLATFVGCSMHVTRRAVSPSRALIVTLVPSLAADVCVLGAGARLVGVSAFSNHIACARGKPIVADASSIDAEKIVALHPDVVVGIASQARLVLSLQRVGLHVVLLKDDSYADIFADIRTLGALLGRGAAAQAVIGKLLAETAALHARTLAFKRHPSVFVVLGAEPIWTVGPSSYVSTLIRLAGGRNAVTSLAGAYAPYAGEALLALQPDVIVSDPLTHLRSVLARQPWRSLRAVRLHHVYIVHPTSILERPGPTYVEGLRWLIDRLTPLAR
ncbi:MAG: ABC transporter substrate-binding protein [Vulcanimicrobiaceae bacterium]